MTITVWPADAVAGAPSYTGRKLRQALGVLTSGATPSRPLGAFSGVRPGSGTVGSATSTVWTVTPHAGVLELEAAAEAGAYLYAIDANVTGSMTAADASNPRVDIVYVTLNDPAEGDGSSVPGVTVGYTAGTPAASPVAPAPPVRSMALFAISVPKVGGGSPTVTMTALEVGAAGSPVGVRSQAQRDSLPLYAGLRVRRMDARDWPQRYDGSAWVGERPFAEAAGSWAVPNQAAGNTSNLSVTFPAGRFTVAPHVMATAGNSRLNVAAASVTATGFQLQSTNWTAATATSAADGNPIMWRAVQTTPTSATG